MQINQFPYTASSLVADSLSLGPHWIYNQAKIARAYPDGVYALTAPLSSYHPEKQAGHLTHYGDQTLWLYELVSQNTEYEEQAWRQLWLKNAESYHGYHDGSFKETLQSKGTSPSSSNDIAGASRIGPILDLKLSLDEAVSAARSQTGLPKVADVAEFFVRAVFSIRDGNKNPRTTNG